MRPQRYHPLVMLFELGRLIKNSAIAAFYLFVLQWQSTSAFVFYGRIIFYFIFGISLMAIIQRWLTKRYELDEHAFQLYKGLLKQTKQSIPYSKVQNHSQHTSFVHRMLHVTSLRFETGISGEDAAVVFKAITKAEAARIIERVTGSGEAQDEQLNASSHQEDAAHEGIHAPARLHGEQAGGRSACNVNLSEVRDKDEEAAPNNISVAQNRSTRTIHFQPTRKDTIKASFTSLSFLVLIPLLVSFYFKLNDMFHVEQEAEGLANQVLSSWWLTIIISLALIALSLAFGMVRTYLLYGKYEISSDDSHIYIVRGVLNESSFSIAKDKVQAVEIKQPLMKRLLGLAEVKLTSAGDLSLEDAKLSSSSLYPYLPVQQAYAMIQEILPAYELSNMMQKLPKASLWSRLARPSWIFIIALGALLYFTPSWFGFHGWWWVLAAVLLISIILTRILDYRNARYVMNQRFIQFRTGSWSTQMFISKREKVIEVKVARNPIQRWLGLATIETTNRSKPIYHASIQDVPLEQAIAFFEWYKGRANEIKLTD